MENRFIGRGRLDWIVPPIALGAGLLLAPWLSLKAQQAGAIGELRPTAKQALRAGVIRLGTEIEILQLEQDADRAAIFDLMKQARDLSMGDENAPVASEKEIAEARKAVADEVNKGRDDGIGGLGNQLLSAAVMMTEQRSVATANIARRKATFARRAAVLVEKRLDLTVAERRYREVR